MSATLAFIIIMIFATTAGAEPLRVITSGGFASTLTAMEAQLEKDTGLDIEISYGSSSGGAFDSIPERLKRDEQFEVLILSKKSLNNLTKKGYVLPESRKDLVNSVIGMSIREGAPVPDISSEEKFIQTLKNVQSIGYSASASGTYLSTNLWPRIGIWEEIKPKSKRILSERVASVVARGDIEIGFQQVSEILNIPGAKLVGPIPDKFQKITTFSTGIVSKTTQKENAQKFINYLTSDTPYVINTISNAGLTPVRSSK